MHYDQICLDAKGHQLLNTFFNVLEMCWIKSGKVPVISRCTAVVFGEIVLI